VTPLRRCHPCAGALRPGASLKQGRKAAVGLRTGSATGVGWGAERRERRDTAGAVSRGKQHPGRRSRRAQGRNAPAETVAWPLILQPFPDSGGAPSGLRQSGPFSRCLLASKLQSLQQGRHGLRRFKDAVQRVAYGPDNVLLGLGTTVCRVGALRWQAQIVV
jgi:hypothetical protein